MADKLTILHMVSHYPPDRIGGMGESMEPLHRALLAEGHDSRVLTSGTTHSDPSIVRCAKSAVLYAIQCIGYLPQALKADLIVAHHGEGLLLLLAVKALKRKIPLLLVLHLDPWRIGDSLAPYTVAGHRISSGAQGWFERLVRYPLLWLVDRIALKLADHAIFISRNTATDVLGADAGRTAPVIYYTLPPPPPEPKSLPGFVELLAVGSFSHRKRVFALPYLLARVRKRVPNARLRIVGFHLKDHPDLLARFREAGVADAVVTEGHVPVSLVYPFYRAAGVLVMPTFYEGLPMVILEAMREGLPSVASRVAGIPEAIDEGVNGHMVDCDDTDAMADRAADLLLDPERRARFAEACRCTVAERFGRERFLSEFRTLYGQLARPGAGPI